MSRFHFTGSYSHRIRRFAADHYRLGWVVDFYYKGQRCRFPRAFSRDTDERGALRFSKRWGCKLPEAR